MLLFTQLIALTVILFRLSARAQTIALLSAPPAGYVAGFATQDYESAGQQSICNTNCPGFLSGGTTSGPSAGLAPGVFAAAINPAMGGGASDCAPCGQCYSVINSGEPLCGWNTTSCPVEGRIGPAEQTGPASIKILIVNHCTDCDLVDGWFDIDNAPSGWNNPKTYWKQLPDSECQ